MSEPVESESWDDGTYLVDRDGTVWLVVRDGGMVTRADYTGATSAGVNWLKENKGPVRVLDVPR